MLVWQSVILCRIVPAWKLTISGREKIVRGTTYVIISNHRSLIDILVLNCLRYRFKWISKIENSKVPVLGWYLKMADYITVDRDDDESKAEMLARSYRCLKEGTSIMIFPEGTRSPGDDIGIFRRGAFQLAMEANVPVLPVVTDGTREILPKHGFILGRHDIKIRVLDPVPPGDFGTDDPEKVGAWFRELMVKELNSFKSNG
jgi:1-acyl-sn-glycerol-3-phosphate acyltransferase